MADVNFTIAIDKEATSGDVSRILNDIEVQLSSFSQKTTGAAGGTDILEQKMSRLANVRTPNLLASANAQLIQMIPLVKDNAAVMTLMQTAGFGATSAISALMGPAGAIAIGVGVLIVLATALSNTKKNLLELTEEATKSANLFAQVAERGFDVSRLSIMKLGDELAASYRDIHFLSGSLVELEASGKGSSKEADNLRDKIAKQEIAADDLAKAIGKIVSAQDKVTASSIQGFIEEVEKGWKEAANTLNLQLIPGIQVFNTEIQKGMMSKPEASPFYLSLKATDDLLKKIHAENELASTLIFDPSKLKSVTEEATSSITQEIREMYAGIRTSNQAFWQSNIFQPIEQGFVNLFSGVEVKWSELIQRMAAEMMVSSIFKLISGFLFPSPGFQEGTAYVPQTGPYILHKGERVMTAEENHFYRTTNNKYMGGNTIIINNYGGQGQDRKQLVKDLRETLELREFDL